MPKNILLLSLFLLAQTSFAAEAQTLGLGELTSLPVNANTRFSVGNGEVIQVRATHAGEHSLLLVKGKSQGYSDLILLEEKGGIVVP